MGRLPILYRWAASVITLGIISGFTAALVPYQRAAELPPEPDVQPSLWTEQGWPKLTYLPQPEEIWQCDVAIVGGSLGGVAAAAQAMRSGATTCLIELTPWLGGQLTSQGVSAIDESLPMRDSQNFTANWQEFKQLILSQWITLPSWTGVQQPVPVRQINSCWVGDVCFPPQAGVAAIEAWLESALPLAPDSRWSTATAFKGAEFDTTGQLITALYGVKRIPTDPAYVPSGYLSKDLHVWYSWSSTEEFQKVPIRLEAKPGQSLIVIDATDTGELVAWSGLPYRVGSESQATTGEYHAALADNQECTQAFTYPFVLAIHDDGGASLNQLAQIETGLTKAEHRREYSLEGFPMFGGKSFFQYRRIVSLTRNNPFYGSPAQGDMALINWNRGNDWGLMNPALLMTPEQIRASGQHHNWLGGLNFNALKDAENHALLFAEWLMATQAQPGYPLAYLSGHQSPLGTESGLSVYPYIREGRRILGRAAYDMSSFMIREQDIRIGLEGSRDFGTTAVALTHYAIDMHGCRYRNWHPSYSANSAPIHEYYVKPIEIPLESLIPQRLDNLLIGGKGIAVTHIVNAATRVHYGEWNIGASAGSIAGWIWQHPDYTTPTDIQLSDLPQIQTYLRSQGLNLDW